MLMIQDKTFVKAKRVRYGDEYTALIALDEITETFIRDGVVFGYVRNDGSVEIVDFEFVNIIYNRLG